MNEIINKNGRTQTVQKGRYGSKVLGIVHHTMHAQWINALNLSSHSCSKRMMNTEQYVMTMEVTKNEHK